MLSRRRFLGASVGAVVGVPMVKVYGQGEVKDKVRLGVVGVADRGAANLAGVAKEAIIALCEVDEPRADAARKQFPQAQFFTDYRMMLDKVGKDLDAVVVSTPDHTHAHAGLTAMRAGKHLYCEKPLAKSVYEARTMTQVARQKKLITQMGTQIHAGDNYRRVVEFVQSGKLGAIKHVHVWCSRQPDAMKKVTAPTPGLKFDLKQWLGPVPEDFFYADSKNWPHFHWRWWWAFGGGVLGDMGCHFMDLAFWALNLKAPTTIRATGTPVDGSMTGLPRALQVDYTFPTPHGDIPLTWYHGVTGPDLKGEKKFAGFNDGVLFEGANGSLVSNYGKHQLLPDAFAQEVKAPTPTIAKSIGHHAEWLEAIRGHGKALCDFAYAGNLTEAVLLGNVAYRTGEALTWDATKLTVTNTKSAAKFITPEFRQGWEI
jgi:predicted dehydrogenase